MASYITDPYTLLGLAPEADQHQIKRAFRRMALRHHPDRDPGPRAAETFRAVHQAYETLIDPARRAAYDRWHVSTRFSGAVRVEQVPVKRTPMPERPPTAMELRIFRALHATGLCFGLALVFGICASITFQDRSWYHLVLTLPGLLILPDSVAGLRR